MNCVNCYQEIPDGSKFCPHCGALQPENSGADYGNTQAASGTSQTAYSAQPETGTDSAQQAGSQPQYQDPYAQYQNAQNYGSGDQNTYTSDYQNNQYQTPPVYQSSYEPEKPINWVPYLVLSIITTLCCCLPFGIVGIVYSTKINSAVNARDWEGAQKAAKTAKIWIIASAIVGFIVEVIYVVMIYAGIAGSGYYYY